MGKDEINGKSGNSLRNRSRCCGDFFVMEGFFRSEGSHAALQMSDERKIAKDSRCRDDLRMLL